VQVKISRRADSDLDELHYYGLVTFGELQAERYAQGLRDLFHLLGDHPQIGRSLGAYRIFFYRSHVVVYSTDDTQVVIERVLAARSNWREYLD
jgi:toxin ParE1/3/4